MSSQYNDLSVSKVCHGRISHTPAVEASSSNSSEGSRFWVLVVLDRRYTSNIAALCKGIEKAVHGIRRPDYMVVDKSHDGRFCLLNSFHKGWAFPSPVDGVYCDAGIVDLLDEFPHQWEPEYGGYDHDFTGMVRQP